jgi:hypothetical protein
MNDVRLESIFLDMLSHLESDGLLPVESFFKKNIRLPLVNAG